MKIQPQALAISGKAIVHTAASQYSRVSREPSGRFSSTSCGTSSSPERYAAGSRNFFRVSHSPSRPTEKEAMPNPIIQRKPQ